MDKHASIKRVVFFDGVCGLCNHFIQFLLKADSTRMLRYSPLQGESAEALRGRHPSTKEVDSVIYVRDFKGPAEHVWIKSDAILAILDDLGGFWRVVSWLRVVPRFVRDCVYAAVARIRYRLFGRFQECRMPTPETKDLFLP